jgi:cytidine deaminase
MLTAVVVFVPNHTIVGGSYLENAAFNPSLAPLQSALVSLVVHQEAFADITRVVLVESSAGMISHAAERAWSWPSSLHEPLSTS